MQEGISEKLQQPVKDLVQRLQGKELDRDGLRKEFDCIWKKLMADIQSKMSINPQPDANIEITFENYVKDLFGAKGEILVHQKLTKCSIRKRGEPLHLEVTKLHVVRRER